ncbi:MAG: hypothetical protein AAGI68_08985 [Planctomycetota bacterium]
MLRIRPHALPTPQTVNTRPQSHPGIGRLASLLLVLSCVSFLGLPAFAETPAEREFKEKREALEDDNIDGRYQLAFDMYRRDELQIALSELKDLESRAPEDGRMPRLIRLIERRLARNAQDAPPNDAPAANPDQDAAAQPAAPQQEFTGRLIGEPVYLDEKQRNLLAVYELPSDLAKAQPTIRISATTMREVFSNYADRAEVPRGRQAQAAFLREPGWKQLDLLFQLRAREYYGEARVLREPEALRTFRSRINRRYVAGYFRRHFGSGQLPLHLYLKNPGDQREAYTNFYILSQYSYDGRPLINRDSPEDSLLLQWGLPRDAARFPAPLVENWEPYFNGIEDRRYTELVEWVRSLFVPEPTYGIQYVAPRYDVAPVIPR